MPQIATTSIITQVRRNAVALISLAVAFSALSYNTWRNELTEHNRNLRDSGFEILTELADLQLTADLRHYDRDAQQGNPIRGWSSVLLIRDLSRIMPDSVQSSSDTLYETWRDNWQGLGSSQESADRISKAIEDDRQAVLAVLTNLH